MPPIRCRRFSARVQSWRSKTAWCSAGALPRLPRPRKRWRFTKERAGNAPIPCNSNLASRRMRCKAHISNTSIRDAPEMESAAFRRGDIMKLRRRQFLHLAASAAALPVASRVAWAQTYPTRLVRIVVGGPPGGPQDILARLMGQWLSERLGQPFVIDNRPGAGTNIAAEAVVRAPADGYTLLMIGAANAINATLYEKLNFNFIRDIAP